MGSLSSEARQIPKVQMPSAEPCLGSSTKPYTLLLSDYHCILRTISVIAHNSNGNAYNL